VIKSIYWSVAIVYATVAAAGAWAQDTSGSAASFGSSLEAYSQSQRAHAVAIANLAKAREKALVAYRQSDEYQQALRAVDETYAAYEKARAAASGDLSKKDPKYLEAQGKRDAAQRAIEQARASEVRDSAYLSQLYNEKAKWANEMKRCENNVLETTGGVALERRWREATKTLQKLEAQKEDAVENSPEVLAARQKEEAVRAQMNQLAIQYAGNRAQYLESAYQQQREDWYREQQYNWIRSYPPGYYDDDGGYRYYRRY